MGKGSTWTDIECVHLSNDGMPASEYDPIIGIYQTSNMFWKKVFDNFREFKPNDSTNKKYNARLIRPTRTNSEESEEDIQTFKISHRGVRAFKASGTFSDQIFSMAIARNTKKEAIFPMKPNIIHTKNGIIIKHIQN